MEKAEIAIVAAMAKNRVIGKEGKIPWNLPEDMEHFRQLTLGSVVVMGRNTFEEIGRPLPRRVNYIVSTTLSQIAGCRVVASLAEAIQDAKKQYSDKKIFLCGGSRIYQEGLFLADKIYLTILNQEVEGDTYFPEMGKEFVITEVEEKGEFSFVEYRRFV